jgi:hypothetical protein
MKIDRKVGRGLVNISAGSDRNIRNAVGAVYHTVIG